MPFFGAVILYVCEVTYRLYMKVLFTCLDKHTARLKIFIAEQQSGSNTPKTNFRWSTRPGSGIPQSKMSPGLPFHTSLLCLSSPLALFSALSSPVDIQWIVVPFFQFAVQVTPFHNGAVLGGWWVGRSSSPGQVRRGLITFQCCFSTLCKEQSVLISIDYRRMLIHCHADGMQTEWERRQLTLLTASCLQQTSNFKKIVGFLLPSWSEILSVQSVKWNILTNWFCIYYLGTWIIRT